MDFVIALWSSLAEVFLDIGPYIIIGLFLAGLLRTLIPDRSVARLLGKDTWWEPLAASLIGVPLPLCSCSVLPFAFGLRKQGAGRGSVTAFLTSTPQTGVDSILVAYSFFGLPFALFKVAVSFVSGAVSGWMTSFMGERDAPGSPGAGVSGDLCGCGSERCEGEIAAENRIGSVGSTSREGHRGKAGSFLRNLRRTFSYAYDELLGDFALTLLLGVLASAAITALVPEGLLGRLEIRWVYYPAVLLLSIPLYICATSSVPLAFSLTAVGLPPGAAMVLLIAGPATNMATIGTVAKMLGRRSAAVYTVIIVLFALAGGILFDSLLTATRARRAVAEPFEFPYPVQLAAAIVLAALLLYHGGRKLWTRVHGNRE